MAAKKTVAQNAGAWVAYLSLGAGLAGTVLEWAGSAGAPPLPGWILLVLGLIVQIGRIRGGLSVAGVVATIALLGGGAGFTVAGGPTAEPVASVEVYQGDIVGDAEVSEDAEAANGSTNDFMVTE